MRTIPPSRTDEQLAFMLDETADWVVSANVGTASYHVASLRMALEGVASSAARRGLTAVVWKASGEIVVFPAQLRRLAASLAGDASVWPDTEFEISRVAETLPMGNTRPPRERVRLG